MLGGNAGSSSGGITNAQGGTIDVLTGGASMASGGTSEMSSGGVSTASGGTVIQGGAVDMAGAGGESEPPGDGRLHWLGACEPLHLSDDGNTVLTRNGIWNQHDGWVSLPTADVMSGDGKVVFGYTSNGLYRWTREGGIEELGSGPSQPTSAPFERSLATNRDGSVLVGQDGVRRWTASGVSHSALGANDECSQAVVMSSDGATIACSDDPFGLNHEPPFVFKLNSAGEYELRDPTDRNSPPLLQFGAWGAPTAMSGDGHFMTAYALGSSGLLNLNQCLLALDSEYECLGANQIVTDLDYLGEHAVGQELPGYSGGRCPLGTFYWSSSEGIRFLSDALFEHGLYVDVPMQTTAQLSADGLSVLSTGTRHLADGSSHDECFLARLSDEWDFDLEGKQPLADIVSLGLSASGGCAVAADGHVACWGEDALKLVGNDTKRTWAAVPVPGVTDAVSVAADADHVCALTRSGQVECWGSNDLGQLGDGSTRDSSTGVTVVGIDNATAVSVRMKSSCAVLRDGTVQCWGDNSNGQLGDGSTEPSSRPLTVPNLEHVSQLVHTGCACDDYDINFNLFPWGEVGVCALRDDHTVWCWGGSDLEPSAPSQRLTDISQIRDDTGAQLCWIQTDGTLGCEFGTSFYGVKSLYVGPGCGSGAPWVTDAVGGGSVPTLPPDTRQIANNSALVCALVADGSVQCAGFDATGALGSGQHHLDGAPLSPVRGIRNARQIAVGYQHVCALLVDGGVRCWGRDDLGQLGNGHVYQNVPYGLPLPGPVVQAN